MRIKFMFVMVSYLVFGVLLGTGCDDNKPLNIQPAITAVANQNNPEGASINLAVIATDLNKGDKLTYSATGLPPGLSIDANLGTITGTIGFEAAAALPYNVEVTVTDGLDQARDTFTWTVENTNRAPAITSVASQSSQEGETINLPLQASDPDGDTLTYSAANLPAGLRINPDTGAITGTIGFDAAAPARAVTLANENAVTITVTDDGFPSLSVSDTLAWTVTNTNRAPTITPVPPQSSPEGATIDLPLQASDPDGDTLTYSAANLPAGLRINPDTGAITGTIGFAAAALSPYTVAITVTDNGVPSGTASVTFVWTVNDAPVADAVNVSGYTTIPITLSGTDTDGTISSFKISTLPSNGTLYKDTDLAMPLGVDEPIPASSNSAQLYFKPVDGFHTLTGFNYVAIDNSNIESASAHAAITVNAISITEGVYEAGFNNSTGYYLTDAVGNPATGHIIWSSDDAINPGTTSFITGVEPAAIGFFIIPDGKSLNPELTDGDAVYFVKEGSQWQAFRAQTNLAIKGEGASVFFDEPGLNLGGLDYVKRPVVDGVLSWEDQLNLGDRSFGNVVFKVSPPQPKVFARVYQDRSDPRNKIFDPSTDVLYVELVDTNGNTVLDAGDTVTVYDFPLDFSSTPQTTSVNTANHIVTAVNLFSGIWVTADTGTTQFFFSNATSEYYGERGVDSTDLYDHNSVFIGDELCVKIGSPSRPITGACFTDLSPSGDLPWIDVEINP